MLTARSARAVLRGVLVLRAAHAKLTKEHRMNGNRRTYVAASVAGLVAAVGIVSADIKNIFFNQS